MLREYSTKTLKKGWLSDRVAPVNMAHVRRNRQIDGKGGHGGNVFHRINEVSSDETVILVSYFCLCFPSEYIKAHRFTLR